MSPSNSYTLFRGLRSYLLDKKYDQQFGDLVPQIFCSSFQTELKIINEEPSGDFLIWYQILLGRAKVDIYIYIVMGFITMA